MLAIGLDIVHVPDFAVQVADGASGFVAGTFTAGELRRAPQDPQRRIRHLAGRYAAKEAVLKAWSMARVGRPPSLASVAFHDLEVLADDFGRPLVRLRGPVADAVAADLGAVSWQVSISHDGPTAAAVAVVAAAPA